MVGRITLCLAGIAFSALLWAQQPQLRMPFPNGATAYCSQANNDTPSHQGTYTKWDVDIVGNTTTVVAAGDGVAYYKLNNGDWGNNVRIDHGNGLFTLYAHLASVSIANGQTVHAGDTIGIMGMTGNATGVHLHFGLHSGDANAGSVGPSVQSNSIVWTKDLTSNDGFRWFSLTEFVYTHTYGCGSPPTTPNPPRLVDPTHDSTYTRTPNGRAMNLIAARDGTPVPDGYWFRVWRPDGSEVWNSGSWVGSGDSASQYTPALGPGDYWWSAKAKLGSNESAYQQFPYHFHINYPPAQPSMNGPRDNIWYNSRALTLSWNDPGDPDNWPRNYRIYWPKIRKDDNSWSQEAGWTAEYRQTTWTPTMPADGRYLWTVAARDGADGINSGDDNGWPAEVAFRIDTVGPVVTLTSGVPGVWIAPGQDVSWSLTDSGAGARGSDVWWDSEAHSWIGGTAGTVTPPSGKHTLHVVGYDAAQNGNPNDPGNPSATPLVAEFWVDAMPPVVNQPSFDVPSPSNAAATIVGVSATDADSGVASIRVYVAGSEVGAVTGASGQVTWNTASLADGDYQVRVEAIDNVGNVASSADVLYKIDRTPPHTTVQVNGPAGLDGWYTGAVTVTLAASDPSGIRAIHYDSGSGDTVYTQPFTLNQAGLTQLRYWSVDNTSPLPGNREAEQSAEIKIDPNPPILNSVIDAGDATDDGTYLDVSLRATAASGLIEARYALTEDPNASDASLTWTAASLFGDPASAFFRAINLDLPASHTHFVRVQVRNGAGLWSASAQSDGIFVSPDFLPRRLRNGLFSSGGHEATAANGDLLQGILGDPFGTTVNANLDGWPGTFSGDPNDEYPDLRTSFIETGAMSSYDLNVTFQDFVGQIAQQPLLVRLWDGAALLTESTLTLGADGRGKYRTWIRPEATDTMTAKGSHWLQRRLSVTEPSDPWLSAPILNVSLVNGDVNGDNIVSIADFNILRGAFGTSVGGPGFDPRADLNGDGTISLTDFLILRRAFGSIGD